VVPDEKFSIFTGRAAKRRRAYGEKKPLRSRIQRRGRKQRTGGVK
jgi:hypothetical protein